MRSYNSRLPLFLSYRTEHPIAHDFPAHGPIELRWASGILAGDDSEPGRLKKTLAIET
jgi:hypothetical protein